MRKYKKNKSGLQIPNHTQNTKLSVVKTAGINTDVSEKFGKYLEFFAKIVSCIMIFGIIVGGINIFAYLKRINFLFIFPEVIGLSYASLSALVIYFIFSLLIISGFYFPIFIKIILASLKNDLTKKSENYKTQEEIKKSKVRNVFICKKYDKINEVDSKKTNEKLARIKQVLICISYKLKNIGYFLIDKPINHFCFKDRKDSDFEIELLSKFLYFSIFWSISILYLIFWIYVFFDSATVTNITFPIFLILFFIFVTRYTYLFIQKINADKSYWFILSMFSIIPFIFTFSLIFSLTFTVIKDTNNLGITILFNIFSLFISGILCLFFHQSFCNYCKNGKYDFVDMSIGLIFVVFYMIALSVFSDYRLSLYQARFVERPQDSSWYIIHNGNTTSETINGMTKGDIKYHQQFFVPNGWQQYCKDDVFNRINMKNCPTLRNKNTLYGYMAWNLGNTKVFCPQSVDFFDGKDNKEKSQKCLVIDGKYLQPISVHYLVHPSN